MGFLSDLTDSVFGGTDKTAINEQRDANYQSQAYIREQTGKARGDAGQLYQQGDYARNLGINLAMALMGQALPQQYGILARGQGDYQNAILGNQDGTMGGSSPFTYMPGGLPQATPMQLPNFGQTWNFATPGQPGAAPQQGGQGGGNQQVVNQALSQLLGGMF